MSNAVNIIAFQAGWFAIMLLERAAALLALACGWALLTPLLLALAKRWNGCPPAVQENSMSGAQHV